MTHSPCRTSRIRGAAAVALALTALWLPVGASAATKGGVVGPLRSNPHTVTPCGVGAGSGVVITSLPAPCTVTMMLGAVTTISLDHGLKWSDPTTSSSVVTVSGQSRSAKGGLSATLSAHAIGAATLSSTGTIICPAGTACPDLARLWTVHVDVVGSLVTPRTVTVSQSDGGRHFTLRRGDRLRLRLLGPTIYTWTAPTASPNGVLRRISSTGGVSAHALFSAAAPGRSEVRTVDNPNCYPQCLPPSRLFYVIVTVTG